VAPRAAVDVGYTPPERTQTTKCKAAGKLPDAKCTPGKVMTTDRDTICKTSTKDRRKVTSDVHKEAFTEYGYSYPQARGAFEVDHLIPLELGGDNDIANLWAQPASPTPGFHEKDHVEDFLHKQYCAGLISLEQAQRQIATDWLSVWKTIRAGGDDGDETGASEP
jgi:hypothetical protein